MIVNQLLILLLKIFVILDYQNIYLINWKNYWFVKWKQLNYLINELFYSNKLMNFLKNKYSKYVVKKIIHFLNDKQKEDISNY